MFDSIKSLFSSRLVKIFASVILLLLAIIMIRSCSHVEKIHHAPYKIGRDTNWYPIQLLGKEKYLVAFTNDIIAHIGSENSLKFQWFDTSYRSINEGLENGTYDLILTTMRPTVVNQERYLFSEIVFECGPVLIVKQGSKATSLDDMKGQTIGILSGLSPVFNAVKMAGAHNFNLLVVTYPSIHEAINDLSNNLIDGVIIDAMPAYNLTQGFFAGALKVITPPFTDEGLRFVALRKAHLEDIIQIINTSIDEMHTTGLYKTLITKWNLLDPATSFSLPKGGAIQELENNK